jgi:hypothetical protein
MFLNLAAGMGFITLVFIFLPYLYLYYLSNSAGDQLVSGDWKGFLFGTIGVLQKASIIITIIVVIMCLTYRQLHGILTSGASALEVLLLRTLNSSEKITISSSYRCSKAENPL